MGLSPKLRHVSGPKPTGTTPARLRSRANLGMPLHERISIRRQVILRAGLAVLIGVISALHAVAHALSPTGTPVPTGTLERIGLGVGAVGFVFAIRVARSGRGLFLLSLFPLAEAAIFVLVANEAPLPFANRWLLVVTASLYLALLVLYVGVLRSESRPGAVFASATALTLCALAIEAGASLYLSRRPPPLPLDAAETDHVLGFADAEEQLDGIGPVPIPNSETVTRYPDNPRGYFRTAEAEWTLSTWPSSSAELEVSSEGAGVYIDRADDPTPYHVQLSQLGLSVVAGTEYLLRFRVRASTPRSYTVAVSMAHDPWEGLGLYQSATVGTEWTSVVRPFTAPITEDNARVQVDLGGDTADVFIADVEVARADGAPGPTEAEHLVSYQWNSRGCRAPEYPIPADSTTFRILALGDSYTAGVGVYDEDLFTAVMERLLGERASRTADLRRFEVINCGVSGFGTREERLYYEQRARAYQADLVLLIMVANDDRSYSEDVRGGYVHTPAKWEHLFRAGYFIQARRHQRPEADFSEAMLEAAALRGLARTDGADLALVLFTNTAGPEWDLLSEHAGSTATTLGLPLLDLRDALSTRQAPELTVHVTDGHPNEVAHRIAGETIVDWLGREGLLAGELTATPEAVASPGAIPTGAPGASPPPTEPRAR